MPILSRLAAVHCMTAAVLSAASLTGCGPSNSGPKQKALENLQREGRARDAALEQFRKESAEARDREQTALDERAALEVRLRTAELTLRERDRELAASEAARRAASEEAGRLRALLDTADEPVAEVGSHVVRFTSVWMLVRDELRKQQKAMPAEQWEAFALARYRAELDEEISDLLLFYDTWNSLAPESRTLVMAMADKRVKDSQNASGGVRAWRRQLRDRGVSVEQLTEIYVRQTVIEHFVSERFAPKIVVHPDELTAEYEKNKATFRKPAAVRFRVLQLDAEGSKRAIDGNPDASPAQVRDFVSARLKEGADFVALTKRFGTYRAADGGWWREGQWTTEADLGEAAWKDALARLKPGEMTVEPVTSASGKGWVFLRLEERREESVAGLNDPLDGRPDMTVADALREKVKAQKLFKIFNDEQARLLGKVRVTKSDDETLLECIRKHSREWRPL